MHFNYMLYSIVHLHPKQDARAAYACSFLCESVNLSAVSLEQIKQKLLLIEIFRKIYKKVSKNK